MCFNVTSGVRAEEYYETEELPLIVAYFPQH